MIKDTSCTVNFSQVDEIQDHLGDTNAQRIIFIRLIEMGRLVHCMYFCVLGLVP